MMNVASLALSSSCSGDTRELKQRRGRRQRERQKKKTKGLDWQNNNPARPSLSFVHFLAVAARLRRETAESHVFLEDVNTRQRPSFASPGL